MSTPVATLHSTAQSENVLVRLLRPGLLIHYRTRQAKTLSTQSDGKFYIRADAFIQLANEQMKEGATPEDVCESILYAAARFTASYTASLTGSAENAELKRTKAIDFLTEKYRSMVMSNYDETTQDMKTGRGNPH